MHILERYALSCGVKIGKPYIFTLPYPLSTTKYITVHNSNKFETRNYDYWEEVVKYIKPEFEKLGIGIIQLGSSSDPEINGVDIDLRGKTSLKQAAHVVSRALMHVGIDSVHVHVASCFNIPIVALYSNMYESHSRPYWSGSEFYPISSDRGGAKPSYSNKEENKTINMITPEEIANKVLSHFGGELISEKTVFTGNLFNHLFIELIPDFEFNPDDLPNGVINVRMDLNHNERLLERVLQKRKCTIFCDKPINEEILRKYRENIKTLCIEITPLIPKDYIYTVKSIGIKLDLHTLISNEGLMQDMRIDLFDFEISHTIPKTKKDIIDSLSKKSLYYKSNKFILSVGELFASELNYRKKIPSKNMSDNTFPVEDESIFWEECDHFRIIEK